MLLKRMSTLVDCAACNACCAAYVRGRLLTFACHAAPAGCDTLHQEPIKEHGVQGAAGIVCILPVFSWGSAQAEPSAGPHDCSGVQPLWGVQSCSPGLLTIATFLTFYIH